MPLQDSEGQPLSVHQTHAKLAARTREEAALIAVLEADMEVVEEEVVAADLEVDLVEAAASPKM